MSFLNYIKNKTKDDTNESCSQVQMLKEQIITKAIEKMELNYMSKAQIEKIINNNKDIDFLDDEIKQEMNNYDIDFLVKKLAPILHTQPINKDYDPKEIVKASCLGDVIGSLYEFKEHDYNKAKIETLPPKGSFYTDDSILSIATMKAVLEKPQAPDFRKAYLQAYKNIPDAGYGYNFILWARGAINNDKGYNSIANGGAIRLSFIPAYYQDINDVIKYTINSVIVTHNNIESIKGSVVLAVCIWMALHGYTKEDIRLYSYGHYSYSKNDIDKLIYKWCQFNILSDTNSIDKINTDISKYINFSVPFAIKCFLETDSYEECMRKIISHFCDTDSICAIAGGLCYAFYRATLPNIDKILNDNNLLL